MFLFNHFWFFDYFFLLCCNINCFLLLFLNLLHRNIFNLFHFLWNWLFGLFLFHFLLNMHCLFGFLCKQLLDKFLFWFLFWCLLNIFMLFHKLKELLRIKLFVPYWFFWWLWLSFFFRRLWLNWLWS